MRATVKDVATRAGVSPKTVSNVISGDIFVRPETRERVVEALRELDYVPNLSARGLRTGRSGIIALALPALATAYSAEMVHHFVEAAHARGWGVQIEETASRPEREDELLSRARSHLVDGLILNPINLAESALARSSELPPAVLIGEVEQTLIDQIRVDSVAAAEEMTAYLVERGAREIAVLGEMPIATAQARSEGYRRALRTAGLALDPSLAIACSDWTPAGGARAVTEFLRGRRSVPDALFCFTDGMALGALSALASAGIRVPQDTLVAGFDDIEVSAYSVPALTTIGFDKHAFAEAALDRLGARIADRTSPPQTVIIPHALIERASTGA